MKCFSFRSLAVALGLALFTGCQTTIPQGIQEARIAMEQRIQAELACRVTHTRAFRVT